VASANVECVKRFVLGPGEHADELRVGHEETPEKRVEDAGADGAGSSSPDAVLDCLHPDVVIHIPPSMPYGGDHIGHAGFLRMGEAMNATWRITGGLDMSFADLADDEVVCFVSFVGESRHTDRTVPMRMVERYRLLDGKIVEIELFYWDTAAIVEATGGVKTIVPE
jgi:uncharacterized protein